MDGFETTAVLHNRKQQFRKILVTLDGSKLAEQVLPAVEALAASCGSTIILMRVVSQIEAHSVVNLERQTASEAHALPEKAIAVEPDMRWDAPSYLHAIEHRLVLQGFRVECECPEAQKPAEAILRRARELEVDLLAIATHGRGSLGRAIFGSVATEVVHKTPCPVLLIRVDHL